MTEYLADIASDMSVFHRVDDVQSMPAVQFFAYADRLTAYTGVLQARAHAEQEEAEGQPSASAAPKKTFNDPALNPELAPYIEGPSR